MFGCFNLFPYNCKRPIGQMKLLILTIKQKYYDYD